MLYQNTQTRQRNLVALSDHIAAVAMYHKSGAITKQDKLLPHAGDAITADLAVQDFGLARPFAKLAAVLCYPTSHEVHSAYRNLMFVNQGRAFESDEISDTMAKITLAQLGVRLGMNGYRHVSIAFRRMLVDKVSEADFQEDLARQIDAEQASHSERVEHSHYAISLDSFAQHSDQRVGLFCDASVRWQNKCQVVPGGTRKPYHEVRSAQYDNLRTQGLFQDDTDDKQGNQQIVTIIKEVISPLLQQLENSLLSKLTQVAKVPLVNDTITLASKTNRYQDDRIVNKAPSLLLSSPTQSSFTNNKEDSDLESQDISRSPSPFTGSLPLVLGEADEILTQDMFLDQQLPPSTSDSIVSSDEENMDQSVIQPQPQTPPRPSAKALGKRRQSNDYNMEESPTKKQHISDEMQLRLASSSQVPASSQLEDTALHHMRHLLNNPEATWTSDEQKAGVLGALDGSKDMVVIARTGSGKTMIPILASLMVPNKFTIVLLPLRALIHDYERRLSTWHVPYQLLTSESINLSPRHSLILVSADLAVRTVFQTAVKVAHQTKQVGLFVFDEGHLVVTDGSYRNALRDANLIRCVPAPLVVLTGTAPPMMVPLIASGLGLVEPYMVIRGPTNRPELKLILRIPQTLQEICNHVEDILLHETPNFQPQDRIIVFVQTKEYGRTLSQRLGCPLYSGDKDDTPDRGGVYNHWIAGDPIMIVATSALYAGNDYGHVRLVIFAGTPSDTLGTFQGLARAGRDTKLATCIILPNTNLSSHRIGTAGIIDFAGVANVLQICKNTPIKCLRS
ncbi:P-loop containing nucleoside triphosphate hydrolase protein, partial [Gymnopus androsaceus JB14]